MTGWRPYAARLKQKSAATSPERILVLDDMTYEGTSWLQAVGLLYALFPQAEIVFVEGGETGWRAEFVYAWLNRFHPDVFDADGSRLVAGAEAVRLHDL